MTAPRFAPVAALLALAACGSTPEDYRLPPPDPAEFADNTVLFWEGEDYTAGGDGTYGLDGAASVYATLREMGYAIPTVTADGIYNNYYTLGDTHPTVYLSRSSGVSDTDLMNQVYTGLAKGDLVFLDYDFDYVWDHVVVYLGEYQGITHAVLNASDYYDEVVVSDMANYEDPFCSDLEWSNVSSKELDVAGIAELQ
jgi:cell wall-associated NlpC family hydrolase